MCLTLSHRQLFCHFIANGFVLGTENKFNISWLIFNEIEKKKIYENSTYIFCFFFCRLKQITIFAKDPYINIGTVVNNLGLPDGLNIRDGPTLRQHSLT